METREPEHQRLPVGPVALHVARWRADAPPLLLLPAMTQTWEAWLPVIPHFAPHFDIAAVDLRGHGRSDKPETGYHLADYATDTAALTTALGWRRPAVIGHSLGGSVARVTQARHPGWAARIVIEDTPPRLDARDGRVTRLAQAYLSMAAKPFAEIVAYYRRRNPTWDDIRIEEAARASRATARGVLETYLAGDEPLTLAETVGALHCPVLLVYGDEASGGFVSDADAALYLKHLPDGRAVQITGAGHSIHARTPDAFARAVLPFLRGSGA